MAQRTIRERGKVSATRKDNLASSHNYSNAMLGTLPLGKSLGCWIAENLSRRQNFRLGQPELRDFPSGSAPCVAVQRLRAELDQHRFGVWIET